MLTYRSFRNADPPVIAALWRSRAGQPGLLQPVSVDLLEQYVFSKLYFDCAGLTLALDDGQPVGFAHAGFGPNADESWISTEAGVTCVVVVRPDCDEAAVSAGLIERSETYLRWRGAKTLYGGGLAPLSPFYLGMYGGSELPGILDTDAVVRDAFSAMGYREIERTSLLRIDLGGFETLVDRQQMQVRRQMLVEVSSDAPTRSWWDASIVGEFDVTRFDLVPRAGGSPLASATFRRMDVHDSMSSARAAGLVDLRVAEAYRRRGLALFLLNEAFRQFLRQGITHVEAQILQANVEAVTLFQRLGFQAAGQGGLWRKD